MMSKRNLIILHLIIGFLVTISSISKLYSVGIIGLGLYFIIRNKNSNDEALVFSAYLAGAEVLLRMSNGTILYETGKYGIILFLTLGSIIGENRIKGNVSFVFYILLLLIGIVATEPVEGLSLRKSVAFNLSGPFLVGIAAIFLNRRIVSPEFIMNTLKVMCLPIISMCVFLYFRTPDLSEIRFGGSANFEASGGFGPNQVATALGLGMFLIGVCIVSKNYLSGFLIFDVLILSYITYRGLLTFSRGGIITGVVCLITFAFFYFLSKPNFASRFVTFGAVSISTVVIVWLFTSSVTGGMLNNRYLGKTVSGKDVADVTSGRGDIIEQQIESFLENPIFGIGVGNGKQKRLESRKRVVAISHNELGRLIEEHGLIGLFSLVLLLFTPIFIFTRSNPYQNAFIIPFFLMWFLTINHSSLRIALPALAFGMSLLKVSDE